VQPIGLGSFGYDTLFSHLNLSLLQFANILRILRPRTQIIVFTLFHNPDIPIDLYTKVLEIDLLVYDRFAMKDIAALIEGLDTHQRAGLAKFLDHGAAIAIRHATLARSLAVVPIRFAPAKGDMK
jgi:hypothetical protein